MQIGMGREKAKAFLKETPELCAEIREKIMNFEAGIVEDEPTEEVAEVKPKAKTKKAAKK